MGKFLKYYKIGSSREMTTLKREVVFTNFCSIVYIFFLVVVLEVVRLIMTFFY